MPGGVRPGNVVEAVDQVPGKAALMDLLWELRHRRERLPCGQLGKSNPGGRNSMCEGPWMCGEDGEKLCGQERSERGESRTRPMLER